MGARVMSTGHARKSAKGAREKGVWVQLNGYTRPSPSSPSAAGARNGHLTSFDQLRALNMALRERNPNLITTPVAGAKSAVPLATKDSTAKNTTPSNKILKLFRVRKNGERLENEFIQREMLGKGAFAVCYELVQISTGQVFAAKVTAKANLKSTSAKNKLAMEIKLHRTLRHNNIVAFHNFYEDEENYYMILEKCNNKSLRDLIRRRGRISEAEAKVFLAQLLDALRYLTTLCVAHRDMKLDNVFLHEKTVKVGDFGLAVKLTSTEDRRKTVCGTPNYIAPEVLEKTGHGMEVDIWAVGVIMYTLLIGTPPFETKAVDTTYERIRKNEYSFPPDIIISAAAQSLIRRILVPNPMDRPTVDQILSDPFFTQQPAQSISEHPPIRQHSSHSLFPSIRGHQQQHTASASSLAAASSSTITTITASSTTSMPSWTGTIADGVAQPNSHNEGAPVYMMTRQRRRESMTPTQTSTTQRPRPQLESNDAMGVGAQPMTPERVMEAIGDSPSANTRKRKRMELERARNAAQQQQQAHPKVIDLVDDDMVNGGESANGARGGAIVETASKRSKAHESPVDQVDHAVVVGVSASAAAGGDDAQFSSALIRSPSKKVRRQYETISEGAGDTLQIQALHHRLSLFLRSTLPDTNEEIAREARQEFESTATSLVDPHVWIVKWVDYSQKFGLGYEFCDGSIGVSFNDATKVILSPSGESVDVYKVLNAEDGMHQYARQTLSPEEMTSSELSSYTRKRLQLHSYFKEYLQKSTKSPGLDDAPIMPSEPESSSSSLLRFVKRWVRVEHAIVFLMSDYSVQVNFFDHSKIVVAPHMSHTTFVSKTGVRRVLTWQDALEHPADDLLKRLTYLKNCIKNYFLPKGSSPSV